MYQRLGEATLKNGETVEIGVITAPFTEFAEPLKKLLGHKGWEWIYQVGLTVEGKTEPLESRFYVARRGNDLISNVSTFEKQGVGVLGHVWTPEAERRKGLCNAIFDKLMPDFRERRGKLMLLGTTFDTPPWHIYRKYGFEAYFEGSGLMRWSVEPEFEAKYFGRGRTKAVEPSWADWPSLNALAAEPEEFVKSFAYDKFYKSNVEDAWIYVLHEIAKGAGAFARVLERESNGAAVGYAWVVPDKRFPGTWLLDLYSHPNHPAGCAKLLAEMKWPQGKVVCWTDASQKKKIRALKAAGFRREATLRGMLKTRTGPADVMVYSRNGS